MIFFPVAVICWVFSFITSLKIKLMNSSKHIEHYKNICRPILSRAQNINVLRVNVFLTGVHRLLVTNKEASAFPSAKKKLPRSTANCSVSNYSNSSRNAHAHLPYSYQGSSPDLWTVTSIGGPNDEAPVYPFYLVIYSPPTPLANVN
jgi:hypothetical protein